MVNSFMQLARNVNRQSEYCISKIMEDKDSSNKICKSTILDKESTVFFTPPDSDDQINRTCSRLIYNTIEPIPKYLLDDDENLSDTSLKIDFVGELHKNSFTPTICSKIFKELSDVDLVRASHVSTVWRTVIRYADISSGRRTSRYIRKMKNKFVMEKENAFNLKKAEENKELLSSVRTPLSFINTKTIEKSLTSNTVNESLSSFMTPKSNGIYRKCPECQSPARTTFRQTGHCMKCDHDFCIHCFYTKDHSPTCQIIRGSGVIGSPNKLANKNRRYSVGSKNNKSRLKRL